MNGYPFHSTPHHPSKRYCCQFSLTCVSLFFKLSDIENNLTKRYKLLELSQIYNIGICFLFKLKNYFETEKRYNVIIIEKYLKISIEIKYLK